MVKSMNLAPSLTGCGTELTSMCPSFLTGKGGVTVSPYKLMVKIK